MPLYELVGCRTEGTATFFPANGHSAAEAREVCAGCEVGGECLTWGPRQDTDVEGVWPGPRNLTAAASARPDAPRPDLDNL